DFAETMRQVLCSALIFLCGIATAHAQPPAPPSWTGTYVGTHVGYEWTSIATTVPILGLPLVTPGAPGSVLFPVSAADVSLRPSNWTGGVLAGQNFRWGLYGLLGWEADASWGHGSASTSSRGLWCPQASTGPRACAG